MTEKHTVEIHEEFGDYKRSLVVSGSSINQLLFLFEYVSSHSCWKCGRRQEGSPGSSGTQEAPLDLP